ncbi:MAG: hypothetical protein K2Q18_08895, partial [Bdellovibrionales bacterium]|nr:hypothetical protein [Bdellovibrionales bacterium]
MKYFLLLSLIIFSLSFDAKVSKAQITIVPYRHTSWNNEWNQSIISELTLREDSAMMKEDIDLADLKELNCVGYNSVKNPDLKKDFWVVFFSSLTRAESAFNTTVKSIAPKGGHGNYGLL